MIGPASPSENPTGSNPYGTPPLPPSSVRINPPQRTPWVSYTLIGVTVATFLLQMLSQSTLGYDLLVELGAKINPAIQAGQFWRLITPVLLHGSLIHIGFNMYALYVIGPGLEKQYGHTRFLALYLLAGFAGNVTSFLMSLEVSLGASTAIFGMLAAEGVFVYQNRRLFGNRSRSILTNIITIGAINLLIGLSPGLNIDNWGHLGGLAGGLLFAWFAGPVWEVEGIYPEVHLVDHRQPVVIQLVAVGVFLLFAAIAVYRIFL
ncbi:MAG: rhomboid family intramembrane serine protease [Anaerolineaceae bacterium]|nr:rhomboid family intramembrane serine protease [Anaerolineaceae bacterium]